MQFRLSKESHFNFYIFSLIFTAGNIPLSPFMISVCMFITAINWIIERDYKAKYKRFTGNKSVLIFTLVYLAHIIWLINTTDYSWGIHDIKIKLPLLVFPLLMASSAPLSLNHVKYILLTFILGVVINTLISSFVFQFFDKAYYNIREISLFISHIRFSLMIVISIGIMVYFIFSENIKKSRLEKNIYVITLIWLIFFLFVLQSFTGIFILLILLFPILFWVIKQVRNRIMTRIVYTFSILFFIVLTANIVYPATLYYSDHDAEIKSLIKYTENGNLYNHSLQNKERENGYYIWAYVCQKEMKKEWNKRSSIDYKSLDNRNQPLRITLIRYLTSKGYHKDSVGISKLTDEDIKLIENGVANHIYGIKMGIYPRIYELIWEINRYNKGYNPSGHSFIQRFEFIKTGASIIRDNFWFGVGTGDVPNSFEIEYEKTNSNLREHSRLRTHNQFITFFISFGFIGFIMVMFALLYPIFHNKSYRFFICAIFLSVMFFSMLNEDTLETHVGVSLFSFFYTLLIFSLNGNRKNLTFTEIASQIKQLRKQSGSKNL